MKNILRRKLLVGGVKSIIALGFIGAFKPLSVFAQSANPQSAPTNLTDALKSIGATNAANSKDILIKAPDIAENGALVPIEITSNIPGTQTIYIIADKNPQPWDYRLPSEK